MGEERDEMIVLFEVFCEGCEENHLKILTANDFDMGGKNDSCPQSKDVFWVDIESQTMFNVTQKRAALIQLQDWSIKTNLKPQTIKIWDAVVFFD